MMLDLDNCTKCFKKRKAVDSLSMQFTEGVYGLLGPNGAGKTTLLRCICGLYRLNSGSIRTGQGQIGYLPQQFGAFKQLTVFQMMEYFATLKKIEKARQKEQIEFCIQQVNLSERMHARISTLSGGMVRRLGIAQAILGKPEILLLDEPTAGLDPEERSRFKNTVAVLKGCGTILISTHIVSDVEEICTQILIMDKGRLLAAGTTAEIAQIARGKVYVAEAEAEPLLTGNYYLKDRFTQEGKNLLRVLSPTHQPGKPVAPTMEDGYLCAVKGL